jgi:Tol biopolymer transport system component
MIRRLLTGVVTAAVVAALAVPSGAAGYSRPGHYTQVDLTNGGQAPVGVVSHTSISGTGRYVAFDSDQGLTPGTGGFVPGGTLAPPSNVYVRDLATHGTELVSHALTPRAPYSCQVPGCDHYAFNGQSFDPKISADGRYVAFTSVAMLVSGDTNSVLGITDVFVYDRTTHRTTRVSVDSQGRQANGNSYVPSISADGRYVSFTSEASNLVTGDTNNYPDVFVKDVRTGQTTRVSVSSTGAQADGCPVSLPIPSTVPLPSPCAQAGGITLLGDGGAPFSSISANGRYLEFDDLAANLVSGDTNGTYDVFVHDMKTRTTIRVSVASGGTQAQSEGTDVKGLTLPVGSTLDGNHENTSAHGISADGRYAVFASAAYNLVPNDSNGNPLASVPSLDVFLHDLRTDRTYRVDVHADGSQCTTPPQSAFQTNASIPSITADGRFVDFAISNCAPVPPVPASCDCRQYVYDLLTGQPDSIPELLPSGKQYTGPNRTYSSGEAQSGSDISSDGRYISLNWDYSVGSESRRAAFVWDRGAAVGVGGLAANGKLSVAGTPSFVSTGVISATGTADLSPALTAEGADLYHVSVAYRPAYGDLFARLDVAQMPMFAAANATLVYGLRLTANGTQYEVRAAKGGLDALASGGASFGLFRFAQGAWTKVATLGGGYGTTGADVTVALPLRDLGVQSGGRLSDVSAFTALGSYDTGAGQLLDQVVLAGGNR